MSDSVQSVLFPKKAEGKKAGKVYETKHNRCGKCKISSITACPVRAQAFDIFGLDGLESCTMGDAVDKLVEAARIDGRFLNTK